MILVEAGHGEVQGLVGLHHHRHLLVQVLVVVVVGLQDFDRVLALSPLTQYSLLLTTPDNTINTINHPVHQHTISLSVSSSSYLPTTTIIHETPGLITDLTLTRYSETIRSSIFLIMHRVSIITSDRGNVSIVHRE